MTHQHLPPTYALVRPPSVADPDALARAVDRVGSDFPAVGAVLRAWLVSA